MYKLPIEKSKGPWKKGKKMSEGVQKISGAHRKLMSTMDQMEKVGKDHPKYKELETQRRKQYKVWEDAAVAHHGKKIMGVE